MRAIPITDYCSTIWKFRADSIEHKQNHLKYRDLSSPFNLTCTQLNIKSLHYESDVLAQHACTCAT